VNLLDRLSADLSRPDALRGVVASISSVNPGGRAVDLTVEGGTVTGIPVADTVASPTAGDVVFVVKMGASWIVLATIGKTAVSGGPNLISNPGFEFGSVGSEPSSWETFWTTGSGWTRPVVATDQKRAGDRSAKGAITLANSAARIQTLDAIPVTPGVQYRVSAWYRVSSVAPSGGAVSLTAVHSDSPDAAQYFGGGTQTTVATTQPATANSWTYLEGLWTPPSGSTFARLDVAASCGASAWATTFWVDDVSLRTV
jgi:hypothetical protein